MAWSQLKQFNLSTAGTKKYWCLQNVRLGYGLPAKYPTARSDWNNNLKQHKNKTFPVGVAVPVYWSLTLTLDGVTADYGHIAVRMPDGRIWTDGIFYANVDSLNRYYLNGRGIYLGWGESVEGIRVVKEISMSPKTPTARVIYSEVKGYPLTRTHKGEFDDVINREAAGKTWQQYVQQSWESPEGKAHRAERVRNEKYYAKKAEHDQWKQDAINANAEVDRLKAELAIASEDTANLNKLGEALQWFIARVGLKG